MPYNGSTQDVAEDAVKVSREQVTENRRRIVDAARDLVRERGVDGVSVADIMKAAGLTHGAFYGYFASKDDLLASAFDTAEQGLPTLDASGREAYIRTYLGKQHRDCPGTGCPHAALAIDAARGDPRLRHILTRSLGRLFDRLESGAPGPRTRQRERSVADVATMVGAIVLARMSDDADISEEILEAAQSRILQGE
jgi:TetR/AcrR family transcriptional regulator, transcriptional repressor for nem operon